jgi:F-type H+-transporting ATPase subunit b
MLEDRRNRIQKDLDDAAAERGKASEVLSAYEEKMRNVDAEGRARIQEAVRDGQRVATEIKEQARGEATSFLERAREEIERDKAKAKIELRREMVNLSLGAAEKLLGEALDEEKNRRMVDEFIEDLEGMK